MSVLPVLPALPALPVRSLYSLYGLRARHPRHPHRSPTTAAASSRTYRRSRLASHVLLPGCEMNAAHDVEPWPRRVESEAQWRELAEHLTAQLALLFGGPAIAEPLTLAERGGFSCRVRGDGALGGALQLEWSGILRMLPADGQPQLSASLFLFSRGRRMQATGQLGSSLELVFERSPPGPSRWIILGWHDDIYGEYEDIEL